MIMPMSTVAENSPSGEIEIQKPQMADALPAIEMGLLTGCQDRPYAFGLAMALVAQGVGMDVIGGDEIDSPELHVTHYLAISEFSRRSACEGQRCEETLEFGAVLRAIDAVCGSLHAEIAAHFLEQ